MNDWALPYIRALQEEKQFDVVLCEYVFFSKALTCFGSEVLKLIDTHDIVGNRHELFLKTGISKRYVTKFKLKVAGINRITLFLTSTH